LNSSRKVSKGKRAGVPLRGKCHRVIIPRTLLIALGLVCGAVGRADEVTGTNSVPATGGQPLWEIGVAGLSSRLPYYRGSDEYRTYTFPVPYVVYRGERFQADREGARGFFYKGPLIETELSVNGNPPVNDGNGVRHGMPELNPLIEIGPAVRVYLHRGSIVKNVYLEGAARVVSSLDIHDLGVDYQGVRGGLGLVVAGVKPGPKSPWTTGGRLGLDVADSRYHGYFYDVDEPYVLPNRPEFHSDGGYSGASLSGWLFRRLGDDVSISVFAKWDNCEGAVYEDSPLVRTKNNITVGAALVWKLTESKTKVRRK